MFHLGSIQVLNNNSKTFRDGGSSLYNDKDWYNQYIPCHTHTHTHTHTYITLMAYYFLQCPFVTLGMMGDGGHTKITFWVFK